MSRPWYDRTPKRVIMPVQAAQAIAKWCIRHSEAIVCTVIGVCVATLVFLLAACMAAEWLG